MSQRTIPLPAGHPLQAVTGLARQIALPHEFAPQRFPSFPALERTATMGFSVPTTLPVPASTAVKVGLARQAAYPLWADQTFASLAYAASYATQKMGPGTVSVNDEQATFNSVTSLSSGNVLAGSTSVGVAGSTGDLKYVPLGWDEALGPLPFVYVPAGFTFAVALGTTTSFQTTSTMQLEVERWVSPGETIPMEFTGSTSAISCTIDISNGTNSVGTWLRPKRVTYQKGVASAYGCWGVCSFVVAAGSLTLTTSTTTMGTYTLTPASKVGFLPLVNPVEFSNSKLPWYATRTTAASVLITNVTQIQKKGGTVLAGRLSPNVVDMWSASQADVTNLHPAEKAFLPLETGFYTYAPPSTDMANFWDYTSIGPPPSGVGSTYTQPASVPLYRLDNDSLVNVAFLTAGPDAESFAVTCDWHMEFRTSSALFQIGLSTLTIESLHQAQLTLAAVGYFFENPSHKAILQSVVSAAKRYGPVALSAIPHPAAKAAAALVMSAKPRPPPKTTSAAASGYMPKERVKVKKGKQKTNGKKGKSK